MRPNANEHTMDLADPSARAASDAAAYLAAHLAEEVALARLAAEVGVSPSHLQRAFTRVFGHSPKKHQTALRAEALKARLRSGEPVVSAGFEAGFGSARGAWEAATPRLGMSAGTYRSGAVGMRIGYAMRRSPLGLVLVGVTSDGVCAVMLGDSESELAGALCREFPGATLEDGDAAASEQAAAVSAYLAGAGVLPDASVDLRGTEFQRRVWTALRRVPAGTTVTYAELAKNVGAPAAHRAVANACGANHVALLVPCHRVVRSDGGLGGYRWGVERKRRLLEREAAGPRC